MLPRPTRRSHHARRRTRQSPITRRKTGKMTGSRKRSASMRNDRPPRPPLLPDLSLLEQPCEGELTREDQVLGWLLLHPLQREEDLAFAFQCHRSTIARRLAALRG